MTTSATTDVQVDLSRSSNGEYEPGRPFVVRALWLIVEALTLLNPMLTSYPFKRWLLRRFGAQIGEGVIIKPNVHVKHPWRLRIGDHAWIGERSWIDNLVQVDIGPHVCLSQGVYVCTGNHDWAGPSMELFARPVVVERGAWLGAFSRIAPGVTVGENAIVALGSVLFGDAEPGGIYKGNPAQRTGERRFREDAAR